MARGRMTRIVRLEEHELSDGRVALCQFGRRYYVDRFFADDSPPKIYGLMSGGLTKEKASGIMADILAKDLSDSI